MAEVDSLQSSSIGHLYPKSSTGTGSSAPLRKDVLHSWLCCAVGTSEPKHFHYWYYMRSNGVSKGGVVGSLADSAGRVVRNSLTSYSERPRLLHASCMTTLKTQQHNVIFQAKTALNPRSKQHLQSPRAIKSAHPSYHSAPSLMLQVRSQNLPFRRL